MRVAKLAINQGMEVSAGGELTAPHSQSSVLFPALQSALLS